MGICRTTQLRCLLCLVAWASAWGRGAAQAEVRTWTSRDGRFRIEAELVEAELAGAEAGQVRLRRDDGRTITVPLASLGEDDRRYVADWTKQAGGDSAAAQPDAAAARLLAANGLRWEGGRAVLVDEGALVRDLRELQSLRRTLNDAAKRYAVAEQELEQLRAEEVELLALNEQYNTQLTQIDARNVTLHNQLVSAVNASVARLKLLAEEAKRREAHGRQLRGELAQTRETCVERVLELRKRLAALDERRAAFSRDPEVRQTLARLGADAEDGELPASRPLELARRRLAEWEELIVAETISLRREGGSLLATVFVNGQQAVEMVVDSGASLVCLPYDTAVRCGIQPPADAPGLTLSIADGSRIEAKRLRIPTLRVGKFTAENVDCAVLDRRAANAPCLLGMSFLGQFSFSLDAQQAQLKLVDVASPEGPGKR